MSKVQQELLTLGALIIIIALIIIASAAALISWWETIPLIIALYGCWLIVTAGVTKRNASKYARSAFSLFGWGICLAALGFGLDFTVRGFPLIYTFAVVLLLLGALAVVAALKTTQKKT